MQEVTGSIPVSPTINNKDLQKLLAKNAGTQQSDLANSCQLSTQLALVFLWFSIFGINDNMFEAPTVLAEVYLSVVELMKTYSYLKRKDLIIRQYNFLRNLLSKEMNTLPQPETTDLFYKLTE